MVGDDAVVKAAEIARELSSPVRLALLRYLATEGPTRVKELSQHLDLPEPLLSNHLRRLRDKDYLAVDRHGRTATYRIASPYITEVIAAMLAASGTPLEPERGGDTTTGLMYARSCYDHVAGELGVRLCEGLLRDGAITPVGDEVQLGPNAEPAFISLGVGMTSLPPRRKLAFLCPDWSHDRAHLGGALGAVVMTGLLSRDWIRPVERSRRLELTPAGREGLATYFAV